MNRKPLLKLTLYLLCLYDVYLYLPDLLDLFKINYYASTFDCLIYSDAAMLLVGGIVIGIALLKLGGRFNRWLGVVMIVMNVVFTPLFILRALP